MTQLSTSKALSGVKIALAKLSKSFPLPLSDLSGEVFIESVT